MRFCPCRRVLGAAAPSSVRSLRSCGFPESSARSINRRRTTVRAVGVAGRQAAVHGELTVSHKGGSVHGAGGHGHVGARRVGPVAHAWQPPVPQASRQAGSRHGARKAEGRPCSWYAEECARDRHFRIGESSAMRCLIAVEPTDTGFSAYSPFLRGGVAQGCGRGSDAAVDRLCVNGIREEGYELPHRSSGSGHLLVRAYAAQAADRLR